MNISKTSAEVANHLEGVLDNRIARMAEKFKTEVNAEVEEVKIAIENVVAEEKSSINSVA